MNNLAAEFESTCMEDQQRAAMLQQLRLTLCATSEGKLVGRSEEPVDVMKTIDRVARSNHDVLIMGESGTNTEMVVFALHNASPRRAAPLVTVDCSAFDPDLLEAELFGHAMDALTGAPSAPMGRVAAAEGGTLFLNEVGALPPALQVKLVHLLEQREYSRVGEAGAVKCDIRVIATTPKDLAAEVREGRFREDLFSRLNVISVHLPLFCDQGDDVVPFVTHFLRTSSSIGAGSDELQGFSTDAPPSSSVRILPEEGIDLRAAVDEFESNLIRQALAKTGGNKNKAAQLLRLNRTTLVEMVKRKRLNVA